jgi:hypothetical protein
MAVQYTQDAHVPLLQGCVVMVNGGQRQSTVVKHDTCIQTIAAPVQTSVGQLLLAAGIKMPFKSSTAGTAGCNRMSWVATSSASNDSCITAALSPFPLTYVARVMHMQPQSTIGMASALQQRQSQTHARLTKVKQTNACWVFTAKLTGAKRKLRQLKCLQWLSSMGSICPASCVPMYTNTAKERGQKGSLWGTPGTAAACRVLSCKLPSCKLP